MYSTDFGALYAGDSYDLLARERIHFAKRPQLVFTSPPFPLLRQKRYGNLGGAAYVAFIEKYGVLLANLLADDGSVVVEIGNAFEPGSPTMSTLPFQALQALKDAGRFVLCQEFIAFNPARLPGPAEWVTVRRIRVKDSFTRLWWLAKSPFPKANNRRVLVPYGPAMQRLLDRNGYNAGSRPSEHHIGEASFLRRNEGAIPSNVLVVPNTASNDPFSVEIRRRGITGHPARMSESIAAFFISFLTEESDLVLDPFAGSNTTDHAAEVLHRRWVGIESDSEYALASEIRFKPRQMKIGS